MNGLSLMFPQAPGGAIRPLGFRARFGDIDYVFCTHFHSDHSGWNTRLEDGRWTPTFPNAKYIFARTEYA